MEITLFSLTVGCTFPSFKTLESNKKTGYARFGETYPVIIVMIIDRTICSINTRIDNTMDCKKVIHTRMNRTGFAGIEIVF
jgi:hypothetical protein